MASAALRSVTEKNVSVVAQKLAALELYSKKDLFVVVDLIVEQVDSESRRHRL